MGKYRAGDIRHCFADITRARTVLDYEPRVAHEDGLGELAAWLREQTADRVDASREACDVRTDCMTPGRGSRASRPGLDESRTR